MAIAQQVTVITNALWPQGDMRDPLGLWGFRQAIVGDASGGSVKVTAVTSAEEGAAYVFTCYSLAMNMDSGTIVAASAKARLLTSWPNIDPSVGVQAYATHINRPNGFSGSGAFTAPTQGLDIPYIGPNDRFLLLYDPRPSAGILFLAELEIADNDLATEYSFEGYGYYWDRSVMQAPGGPRHPGSN